jgi:hypothetical protein
MGRLRRTLGQGLSRHGTSLVVLLPTAEVNTLVKQGSALRPLDQASPQDPVHQMEALVCKSPGQARYGGRDRV